jgi:excisionase family DNA binding protein
MNTQTHNDATDRQSAGPERLYTVDQIANLGGPRRAKLYNDIRQGKLKTLKFGRSTRISESAWRAYLDLAASS